MLLSVPVLKTDPPLPLFSLFRARRQASPRRRRAKASLTMMVMKRRVQTRSWRRYQLYFISYESLQCSFLSQLVSHSLCLFIELSHTQLFLKSFSSFCPQRILSCQKAGSLLREARDRVVSMTTDAKAKIVACHVSVVCPGLDQQEHAGFDNIRCLSLGW